jgi:hypothetical protein
LYEARHSNLRVEAVAVTVAFAEVEKRFDTNRKSKKVLYIPQYSSSSSADISIVSLLGILYLGQFLVIEKASLVGPICQTMITHCELIYVTYVPTPQPAPPSHPNFFHQLSIYPMDKADTVDMVSCTQIRRVALICTRRIA